MDWRMLGAILAVPWALACSSSSTNPDSTGGSSGAAGAATGGTGGAGGSATGGSGGATGGTGSGGCSSGVQSPSCVSLAVQCNGESCCTPDSVTGGVLAMGRGAGQDAFAGGNADEQPEHDVAVDTFVLDRYEVTVARFRNFVQALPCSRPAAGAGAHPKISGSGWQQDWDAILPADVGAWGLACDAHATWTDSPGDNELMPINCVSWYQAFAFCAWDGGRLPTEAEWEYAAAGTANNLYPWGSNPPDPTLAVYSSSKVAPVGSVKAGKGPFGHLDLAGSMWEWVLDLYSPTWYSSPPDAGSGLANLSDGTTRGLRGGSWSDPADDLRAARRGQADAAGHGSNHGFRCAR